jgi:hypothetical protein
MRAGERLHHEFASSGPRWWLSRGWNVPHEIARIVVRDPHVRGDDSSALFGVPTQSFHWVDQFHQPNKGGF